MEKMELLAPAGNMENENGISLRCGCRILAGKQFGLRAYGGNFSKEQLKEAVDYAHERGKSIYNGKYNST